MDKKNLALIGIVAVLAAVYVIYFTDWFRSKPIVIADTSRPISGNNRKVLIFSLGERYIVTEIKVVPLDEWHTNKLALPLWHLVGKTSDPLNHFFYGRNLDGLNPEVDGARAQPLQPGINYRIFVSAGSAKGWHDFQTGPAPPSSVRPGP
ncbi:MAG TPA: hypothetical protein VGI03_05935 [Verrucomicrobiae bacterium]|jgi:hypothetical protein